MEELKKIYIKKHFARLSRNNMVRRSRKRGMEFNISLKEFKKWLSENNFDKLWRDYENSGFDKWMKPSVDRTDSSIGYIFSNMKLMTWNENFEKGCSENTGMCKAQFVSGKR